MAIKTLERVSTHLSVHKDAYTTAITISGFLAVIVVGIGVFFGVDPTKLRFWNFFGTEKIVNKRSDQASEADRHLEAATSAYFAGKPFVSRREYHSALTLYRRISDRLGEANVLSGLGDLERILGNNDKARENYFKAAQLYGQVGLRNYHDAVIEAANSLN